MRKGSYGIFYRLIPVLIAPLTGPLVLLPTAALLLSLPASDSPAVNMRRSLEWTVLFGALLSYAGTLLAALFVVPWLKRSNLVQLRHYMVAGAAAGLFTAAVLSGDALLHVGERAGALTGLMLGLVAGTSVAGCYWALERLVTERS